MIRKRRKLLEQIGQKIRELDFEEQRVFSESGRRNTDGEKTCIGRG